MLTRRRIKFRLTIIEYAAASIIVAAASRYILKRYSKMLRKSRPNYPQ